MSSTILRGIGPIFGLGRGRAMVQAGSVLFQDNIEKDVFTVFLYQIKSTAGRSSSIPEFGNVSFAVFCFYLCTSCNSPDSSVNLVKLKFKTLYFTVALNPEVQRDLSRAYC